MDIHPTIHRSREADRSRRALSASPVTRLTMPAVVALMALMALMLPLMPPAALAVDTPAMPGQTPEEMPDEEPGGAAPEAGEESAGETAGRVPDEVAELCKRIGGKLGSVSSEECRSRPLFAAGGLSVQGAPILVAEYPPLPPKEPLGRILLLGGIHGDEYSSVSVVFKWLAMLDRNHSGLFHWRVVPLLNPDGLLRGKSQRTNDRGVDLNRNFPSLNWQEETKDYWIRRTGSNPRRFPGPAPLSEPESSWFYQEIGRFRPDVIVSVHAPSHVVDYDGPKDPPAKLGPLYLDLMGTYPGSLGRFAGVLMALPVVTIELPSAGIMPTPAEQTRIWNDLIRYLRLNVPTLPRIWGPVPATSAIASSGSSASGAPSSAADD